MNPIKRKAFNFYRSYFDIAKELPKEDREGFLMALFEKQFNDLDPDFSKMSVMSKFAYISQKHSIDKQLRGFKDANKSKTHSPTPTTIPMHQTLAGCATTIPLVQEKEQEQVQVQEKEQVQVQEKSSNTFPSDKNLIADLKVIDVEIISSDIIPFKENQKSSVKKVFSEEVKMCFLDCLNYFPIHLHPKSEESWLKVIEKLNRIDKIPLIDVVRIVKSVREDNFWSKNFLSLTKLRKKNKEGILYIVAFNEKFKPKEKTINRQTLKTIKQNATGW